MEALCETLQAIKAGKLLQRKRTLELLLTLLNSNADIPQIGSVLCVAMDEGVLTEADIGRKLLIEQSTVNRWRNDVSSPSKRKRHLVLNVIREALPEAIKVIEEELAHGE